MSSTTTAVIVGGGAIGCSIAYNLCKAGIHVTVLDQGEIGAEASSAAAGLLAPLGSITGPGPFADLLLASFALFPTLVPQLEEAGGVRVEYERTGSLRVVCSAKHVPNLRKRMQAWQPLGLHMEWLAGEAVREREPLLSREVCAGIFAPEESQVRAARVAPAFAQAAARLGAVLTGHCRVTGITHLRNNITGVTTERGETIACDHLVVATGAWSATWSEWLHIALPVSPQRGQILALRQPEQPLRHIIFGEAIYLAPKQDGTIVVGATKEEAGFEKQLTAGGVAWLLSSAIHLVPALEACAIDHMWTGLRPRTPDNQPILGRAPGWENVTLATGHGSVGIMLSAITGRTIAELITTGTTPELIRPFGVDRLPGRVDDI